MFIAYEVSIQLVTSLREIVPIIERSDRDLARSDAARSKQRRLNLAEGQRSRKGNKQKHYAIAHGSANEVKAALEVARAWGWIDEVARTARATRSVARVAVAAHASALRELRAHVGARQHHRNLMQR